MQGVDYVLHTASPFFVGTDESKLVKPAVNGTLNVLRACAMDSSKVRVRTRRQMNYIVSHSIRHTGPAPLCAPRH